MSTAPVLETRDVAVHYGGVKALDGIDLALAGGLIHGILGPNGSGKSTLVAAITGLAPLTRGGLLFEGGSYTGARPHEIAGRGIARTFQTVRLLADRTVHDNIALGAGVGGRARRTTKTTRDAVDAAVERTGLGTSLRLRPDELSYGAQRRVEIARAIATGARLLLLDEPTAGMNRHERAEIGALLTALRDEGLTLLLVEHDVQMMVDTCDRLYAMNFGRLIAEGTPAEVVGHSEVRTAYLGRRGGHRA